MSAGDVRFYRKLFKSFRWCEVRSLLGDSFNAWNRHKAPRLGASLAFYSLLSLAPLLLVMVSIVGLVFGQRAAQTDVVEQVQELAGPQAANSIQSLLKGLGNTGHGMIATFAGTLTLLFGASGVLAELRDALNTIWEIPTPELKGWRTIKSFIGRRLFSVAFVVAIGFLLVVTLTISVGSAFLGELSASTLPLPEPLLHLLNELISFIAITGVFAAIYKLVPDVRMEWHDVILGGAATSLLFTGGKLLLGLYLGKVGFASTYGAAASIVVPVVWIYYSGQIFFMGAEITKTFANRYGSQPSRHQQAT